jgi:bacterioferritin-associated ferredoxin
MEKEELIIERLKPGCICKGIRRGRIMDAIDKGAKSFREIAKKTGIGGGQCGAERCGKTVKELLCGRPLLTFI